MKNTLLPVTITNHCNKSNKSSTDSGSDSISVFLTSKKRKQNAGRFVLKLVLSSAFMVISLSANAQFKKGDKFVGGYFTIRTQNSSNEDGVNINSIKFNSISVNPFVGFFLNDSWAVGGLIGYSSNYQKSTQSALVIQTSKDQSFSLGLFGRRYFGMSDKFFFVLHGETSYARGTQATNSGSVDYKSNNYSVGLSIKPMFIFFPSPKWGIEGGLGSVGFIQYRGLTTEAKSSSFNLTYGGLSLGVTYYITASE